MEFIIRFFDKWWKPVLIWLIALISLIISFLLGLKLAAALSGGVLIISLLMLIVSSFIQFARKNSVNGILSLLFSLGTIGSIVLYVYFRSL